MPNRLFFLACLFLGLMSCESSDSGKTEETSRTDSDSVAVFLPPDLVTLAPELIGSWKLEEVSYGSTILSTDETGESSLEFTKNGLMISSTPDLPPEESRFTFESDTIRSEIDGTAQRIESISNTSLVLVSIIDDTEIKRVYSRNTN
jgi:hypothetical protein